MKDLQNFTVRPYFKYKKNFIINAALAVLMTAITINMFVWGVEFASFLGSMQLIIFLSPIIAFICAEMAIQYGLAFFRRRIIVEGDTVTYVPKAGKRKVFDAVDVSNIVIHVTHPTLASIFPGVKLFPTKYIEIYLNNGSKIRFSAKYVNSDLLARRFQSKKISLTQRDRVR